MNVLLIICTTVMFISACITYLASKKIAAWVYVKTVGAVPGADLKPSPYNVSRELNSGGEWGYCITKHDKIMYSDNAKGGKSAFVFASIKDAVKEINKLEAVQGYIRTNAEF